MTARIHQLLMTQLRDDEQVLWTGRPSASAFVFRNWMLSVVGVFWLVLTLMWVAGVASGHLPVLFYVVALPLLLIAGWMIVGHVLLAAAELPHVHYVLTDWRVVMTHGLLRPRLRTIPLSKIVELDLCPRANGYGDIRLGLELGYWDGARWSKAGITPWGPHDMVLRGIPACAHVYAQLTQAIRGGFAAPTPAGAPAVQS